MLSRGKGTRNEKRGFGGEFGKTFLEARGRGRGR